MADVASLALEVKYDSVQEAQAALDKLTESGAAAEGAAGKLHTSFDGLSGAIGGFATLLGVGLGLHDFISEIGGAEAAFAQLQNRLHTTGDAVGFTASQLKTMAETMAAQTGVSSTSIIAAEALGVSFNKIGHDIFPQVLQAAVDLSVRMGTDVPSAMNLLARALENPIAGLGLLARRLGIDPEVIAHVKALEKAGQAQQAEIAILDAVTSKTAGTALALGSTLPGAIGKLQESFHILEDAVGEAGLSKSLSDAADRMTAFVKSSDGAASSLGQLAGGAVGHASDAVALLADHLTALKVVMETLIALKLAETVYNIAAAIGSAVLLTNPWLTALDLVGLAIIAIANNWDLAKSKMDAYNAARAAGGDLLGPPTTAIAGPLAPADPGVGIRGVPLMTSHFDADAALAKTPAPTGGGGVVLTAEQQKQLAEQQALNSELQKQNLLLAQTDPLQRAVALSTSDAGKQIAVQAEYYKVLAQTGVPAIAALAAQNVVLKDRTTEWIAAAKLAENVSDPYQKLGATIAVINQYEKDGVTTAQTAARERIAAINSVYAAQTQQLRAALDLSAQTDLRAGQTISVGGGATAAQVAQQQALNTALKERNFLETEGLTASPDYKAMRLALIDETDAVDNNNKSLAHAIDLYNQALSPAQKLQKALADIKATADANPLILTPDVVKALDVQATDAASGITPAFKEMRDAVTSAGNALDSTFSKAIAGGQSFRQILAGLLQDLEKIALQSLVEKPLQDELKRGVTSGTTPISAGGSVDPSSWIGKIESFFGWLQPAGVTLETGATELTTAGTQLEAAANALLIAASTLGGGGGLGVGAGGSFSGSAGTFGIPDFNNFLNGGSGLPGSSLGDIINGAAGGFPFFAKGDVFHSPTLGVLGDAGPEAAMPLMRGPGGDLGVRAHGGGGGSPISVVVNDHSTPGNQVQASQSTNPAGQQQLEIVLMDKIAKDITQGGRVGRSIDTRYGIARKPMGRS